MSTAGIAFMMVCSAVALIGAIGTVALRNPLRAVVSLLFHIIALSGLYLSLNAHLLAAIQLLIYAGAVVVLFLFVIMLIGPSAVTLAQPRGMAVRAFGAALVSLVFYTVATSLAGLMINRTIIHPCPNLEAECNQFGGVQAIGQVLFREAIVPFELTSVLLLVAIVGAVAVARGKGAAKI